MTGTRIVVGLDGSPSGERALAFAKEKARQIGDCTIMICYVIEWSPFSFQTAEENAARHLRREEEIATATTRVVDPAVAATRAAMEEGIVPGGGIALFNVYVKRMNMKKEEISVVLAAETILNKTLQAPITAIIGNSGESTGAIIKELETKKQKEDIWLGFNASSNKIENLKEAGIIDPLKVVKTAFINAISVASNYLMVGVAITNLPEKKEKDSHGHNGEMGGY